MKLNSWRIYATLRLSWKNVLLTKKTVNLTLSAFDSQFLNFIELLNSCKHFIRLINLSSVHLKYAFEASSLFFLKVNQEFLSHVGKMGMWKIWCFHPGLKFHLGLAKPSWDLNSVYRAEIFTDNCSAISKRSLLFSQDEISAWYTELKFQTGLKISIWSALRVNWIGDMDSILVSSLICERKCLSWWANVIEEEVTLIKRD